ncbi:hypothetical protein FH972_021976 [Carpinus fangiana]|uniref:Uncharacterized protein n=1 Tax=Carpinus fangiana TaxID=176857 RepID=A0A5N6KR94_9ROSI|nr:hypothetical protein FH972_021976 [Carpinus fangiana]
MYTELHIMQPTRDVEQSLSLMLPLAHRLTSTPEPSLWADVITNSTIGGLSVVLSLLAVWCGVKLYRMQQAVAADEGAFYALRQQSIHKANGMAHVLTGQAFSESGEDAPTPLYDASGLIGLQDIVVDIPAGDIEWEM